MFRTGAEAAAVNCMVQKNVKGSLIAGIDKDLFFMALIVIISGLYGAMIVLPMAAIFGASGLENPLILIHSPEIVSAVRLSLLTSTVTLILVFIAATPVVIITAHNGNQVLAKIFDVITALPTVLPPAVAGVGLLLTFGRNGLLGNMLGMLHIEISFSPYAVIIAQFFVSSAFYIQILKTAINAVGKEIFEVSYIMGAGRIETYLRIILPMVKKSVIAGLAIAWTRALGEFGATIMFAGNILGRTRTVPLSIYTLMQTDIRLAASLSTILLIFSFGLLYIVGIWLKDETI